MSEVGDKGKFIAEKITIPDVNYTIIAISSISALVSLGLDVFTLAYEPYGLTSDDYNDHSGSTEIYTLVNERGSTIHVPTPYVSLITESGYVAYTEQAMVVHLGVWPERTFDELESTVSDMVTSRLGVRPTVAVRPVSRPKLISQEDHEYREFIRGNEIKGYIPPEVLIQNCNDELNRCNIRIQNYIDYITKYLKHCKKRCDEFIEPPPELEPCITIESRTFRIACPCRVVRPREFRKLPVPQPVPVSCGNLYSIFRKCDLCISPYTYYYCKPKIRYPEKPVVVQPPPPCTGIIKSTFGFGFRICPIPYYSPFGRCIKPTPRPMPVEIPPTFVSNCMTIPRSVFTSSLIICPINYYLPGRCSKPNKRPPPIPVDNRRICSKIAHTPFRFTLEICPVPYYNSRKKCK